MYTDPLRRNSRFRRNALYNKEKPKVTAARSSQPKETLCESCKIMHLNVQRVGSLDLCPYCKSLFDDDATFRFKRGGQYGFERYKRVKVLYLDVWYSATMVDFKNGRIKLHYDGWSDKFDEWILAGSKRIKDMTLEE
ncbi:12002_t:CDS:1, partial [Diversispora eburnea]